MKKADVTKGYNFRRKPFHLLYTSLYTSTSRPFCVPVMIYKLSAGVSGFYTHACFLLRFPGGSPERGTWELVFFFFLLQCDRPALIRPPGNHQARCPGAAKNDCRWEKPRSKRVCGANSAVFWTGMNRLRRGVRFAFSRMKVRRTLQILYTPS